MKHATFAVVLALYIVVIGQLYAYYAAAVMAAVYIRHRGRLMHPIAPRLVRGASLGGSSAE